MRILGTVGAFLLLAFATPVKAQNVGGRVSSGVGGAGAAVTGQAALGTSSGPQSLGAAVGSTSSTIGGDASGGLPMKLGDKVIKLRGAFGVQQNQDSFRAGVGLPF
jgi:hypothetical protein